ncbi:hypothetical protein ZIOFF_065479 [Zingiber officinale]|uniref:Uncharacterized protein n=1 Tax=Zingiber officinale TaxID=94328 RepID=A0A8J5F054_ZINOF|nr:hypothetical protein ZIOFF_065479 [Zingiber officinale]
MQEMTCDGLPLGARSTHWRAGSRRCRPSSGPLPGTAPPPCRQRPDQQWPGVAATGRHRPRVAATGRHRPRVAATSRQRPRVAATGGHRPRMAVTGRQWPKRAVTGRKCAGEERRDGEEKPYLTEIVAAEELRRPTAVGLQRPHARRHRLPIVAGTSARPTAATLDQRLPLVAVAAEDGRESRRNQVIDKDVVTGKGRIEAKERMQRHRLRPTMVAVLLWLLACAVAGFFLITLLDANVSPSSTSSLSSATAVYELPEAHKTASELRWMREAAAPQLSKIRQWNGAIEDKTESNQKLWKAPLNPQFVPCSKPSLSYMSPQASRGYLLVSTNGGLNQMRAGVRNCIS